MTMICTIITLNPTYILIQLKINLNILLMRKIKNY